jgi:hypothetical protein
MGSGAIRFIEIAAAVQSKLFSTVFDQHFSAQVLFHLNPNATPSFPPQAE